MSGEVHVFNILLQPAALNSLVGVDMTSLVNDGISARDVIGKRAVLLNDTVRSAPDFASRIAAAERWFEMMQNDGSVQNGIGYTSRLLLASRVASVSTGL